MCREGDGVELVGNQSNNLSGRKTNCGWLFYESKETFYSFVKNF